MVTILTTAVLGVLLPFFAQTSLYNGSVVVFICLVSFSYLFDVSRSKKLRPFFFSISVALIVRLICLALFRYVYTNSITSIPIVSAELFSDPLEFYNHAVDFANGELVTGGGFFSSFIGSIYRFTGCSRLLGEFIVTAFSMLVIQTTVSINEEFNIDYRVTQKCLWILALMPNFLLLSAVLRRETIIAFLIGLSLLEYIRWAKGKGISHFAFCILYALAASLFHGGTGLIVIGYILTLLLYNPKTGTLTLRIKNLFIAAAFFLVFLVVFVQFGETVFAKLDNINDFSTMAKTSSLGGSSYAEYVGDSSTLSRFFFYLIPRYLYFMFSPFPWQWRGIGDIISFITSSLVYLFCLLKGILYLFFLKNKSRDKSIVILLIMVAVVISVAFSWGVSNTGTAIRHRDKFILIYFAIFAITSNNKYVNTSDKGTS